MAILELFPHDIHTVHPATVAAPRDFWARLPELTRSVPTARLLMVASSFDGQQVRDGFLRYAVPEAGLPPLVGAYRTLFEQHIQNATQTTRFMRLFLVFDTNQSDDVAARLVSSYGMRAQPLRTAIPLPFAQVTSKWTRGETADGKRWAVVQSAVQQTGQLHLTCLHNLFALDFPLWLSLDVRTLSKTAALTMLRRKTTSARFERGTDMEARAEASDVQQIAGLLRSEIQHSGMGLHHLRLSILVGAESETHLRERLQIVRSASGLTLQRWESSIDTVRSMFAATPPMSVQGSLMTTRGVLAATGSPLVYRRRTATDGVLIGTDDHQAPVVFNLFDDNFPSYNVLALGQSGSGKTFSVQLLALRHMLTGCRIIMVDPQGNIDWSFLGDDVCQMIRLGTEQSRLNVLDITHDELPVQIESVLSILKLLEVYGDHAADALARSILDQLLTAMYTHCWQQPNTQPPTLSDLKIALDGIAAVEHQTDIGVTARNMSYRLARYVEGSQAELFGGHSTVDFSLGHPVTIFDISALPNPETEGNLRAALLSILVGSTSQSIKRLRKRDHPASRAPIIWFIDEMGVLMRDPVIASNTSYEFKTARARLVSMIVADQDLHSLLGRADHAGTHHGEPMLANAAINMIFFQREGQREMIDRYYPEIPVPLRERIYQQGLGQCILQLPNDVLQMMVRPSDFERVLLSSRLQDRTRRREMIAKLRRQLQGVQHGTSPTTGSGVHSALPTVSTGTESDVTARTGSVAAVTNTAVAAND